MAPPERMLSFENRQIKMDTAEQAEPVAQEIENFGNMSALELKGNTVGVAAGERLAQALSRHPELKRCLWSDMFTGRLKNEIPPILTSLCSAMMQCGAQITELDLSDNAFGPIGAEGISTFLMSPSAYSLEVLRLNNNGLGAGGKIVADCLLQCYENAKKDNRKFRLRTFVAGRNRLEDPGAIALAKAFSKIGSLEVISIPQNGIRSKGISALAEALQMNTSIRHINFNDNTCGVDGAEAMASAISEMHNLEVLDLGDCLCRDDGVFSIISELCDGQHHAIQFVDISGSELSADMGVEVLSLWMENFGDMPDVKLVAKQNCFGSRFEDMVQMAEECDTRIDLGDEEDDEGSMSERESSEDEADEESEEEEVVEPEPTPPRPAARPFVNPNLNRPVPVMNIPIPRVSPQPPQPAQPAQPVPTAAAAPAVFGMEDLLRGVGCMSVGNDVVSFLDRQLKLDTAENGKLVADVIDAQKNMRVLELRGNTLGIPPAEVIAESLKKHPELKCCWWSDLFTGRMKTEIPIILKSMCSAMMQAGSHITELDLSDNAFGPIGADGIKDFLVSPSAYSLEKLKLDNCGLGGGGVVVAQCLQECHKRSIVAGRPLKLKSFSAGRNRLEIPGAIALAAAFKTLGTMEEIVMHQDGIGAEGIVALANSLPYNKNLRIVNFNDNTATQTGSFALATAIKSLVNLESISFGDCLCRNQGCHAIVDALSPSTHKKLKELDLSGAELSGESAIHLIRKWRQFPSARLSIGCNNFGNLFDDVIEAAKMTSNVDVGDEEDDCGSASDEEELNSPIDSEDEDDGIVVIDGTHSQDLAAQARNFASKLDGISETYQSASQESAAKVLLQLASLIQQGHRHPEVVGEAIAVAEDVVVRVASVRRRPIATTTQLVNHICAQMGFVKSEENWGIRPDKVYMKTLLEALIAKGLFADEITTIRHFFK